MKIRYFLVDVFADVAFQGAAINVVIDEGNLTPEQMGKIADESHASESVFVQLSDNYKKNARAYYGSKPDQLASHTVIAATQVLANHCDNQIPVDGKIQFEDSTGHLFDTHVITENG